MTIKHYKDIDYSVMVPEDIYLKFVEEARRMAIYGENGKSAFKYEIERAYFRFTHFGRRPELEQEIVGRTMVAEEVF